MTRRIILAVAVLIAAAVAVDWTFWYRFVTIRDQTAVSLPGWISPTATVEGDFREEPASVDPADRVLSPGAIAELTDYAEQVESFSLIVHHGEGIQFEKYWREFGPDGVTETYSMAKSVLGLMFGLALEDGSIGSIDEPVTRYVSEWEGTDKEGMTIRHVLQMASGLEHFRFDFSYLQNPYNKGIRLFIGSDMENALLRFDLTAAPGTEFTYNSANTQAAHADSPAGDGPRLRRLRFGETLAAIGRQTGHAMDGPGGRHAQGLRVLPGPARATGCVSVWPSGTKASLTGGRSFQRTGLPS